jgi:hypothetical protein
MEASNLKGASDTCNSSQPERGSKLQPTSSETTEVQKLRRELAKKDLQISILNDEITDLYDDLNKEKQKTIMVKTYFSKEMKKKDNEIEILNDLRKSMSSTITDYDINIHELKRIIDIILEKNNKNRNYLNKLYEDGYTSEYIEELRIAYE